MSAMYQKYLDPVVDEFTTGDFYREVVNAKKEYFEKAGTVFEDDTERESRMNMFMDWYLFDRDLPGVDLPPIKYFFKKNQDQFTSQDLTVYKDLCSTIHSLFKMKRRAFFSPGVIVKDLFTGKRISVQDSEITLGLNRGDVFEARLIPFRGKFEFSAGICVHPQEMSAFIIGEIKKVRYQDKNRQTKLILQLSQMRLNQVRYAHIDVREIYRHDSKILPTKADQT